MLRATQRLATSRPPQLSESTPGGAACRRAFCPQPTTRHGPSAHRWPLGGRHFVRSATSTANGAPASGSSEPAVHAAAVENDRLVPSIVTAAGLPTLAKPTPVGAGGMDAAGWEAPAVSPAAAVGLSVAARLSEAPPLPPPTPTLAADPLASGDSMGLVIQEEIDQAVHTAVEQELENINAAVHEAFELELEAVNLQMEQTVERAVETAVETALLDRTFDIKANFNTMIALTGVILYWRGIWNIFDTWLGTDNLQANVGSVLIGLSVMLLFRIFKLPLAEFW